MEGSGQEEEEQQEEQEVRAAGVREDEEAPLDIGNCAADAGASAAKGSAGAAAAAGQNAGGGADRVSAADFLNRYSRSKWHVGIL